MEMTLRLVHDRADVDCRLVHKNGALVGVRFLGPFRAA